MRIVVARFPGANCDQDALHQLRRIEGIETEYGWHEETDLAGFDGAFIPGGFSYGDYLRSGAIAARSPIMRAIVAMAERGLPVIGVCNGFQVLCEAGLLPGALTGNTSQKFVCEYATLRADNRDSPWTRAAEGTLRIPVAHGDGRYVADEATLDRIEERGQVAFRYTEPAGNPNGSARDIAGVLNEAGNVLGMMPHPERAAHASLGSDDGLRILGGFLALVAN